MFDNISLRGKLTGVILISTCFALIIGIFLIALYEYRAAKVRFLDGTRVHARFAAEFCRDSVIANNRSAMEAALENLEAIPSITSGVIFDRELNPLAVFKKGEEDYSPPVPDTEKEFGDRNGLLFVLTALDYEDQTYGWLYMEADKRGINRTYIPYVVTLLIIFGGIIFFTAALSQILQRMISTPITGLVRATNMIAGRSGGKGKSLKKNRNEVAVLRERFDYLLDQIQMKDLGNKDAEKFNQEIQALREQEEYYRSLIENMPLGQASYEAVDDGRDFILRRLNSGGERLEHRHRVDLVGKPISEIFPAVKDSGLLDVMRRVLETGKDEFHGFSQYHSEGDPSWREHFVFLLPSGDLGIVFLDSTAKKNEADGLHELLEREREAHRKEVEALHVCEADQSQTTSQYESLSRELEGLFSIVADDLKTPLKSIDDFSKSMLQDYARDVDDEGKNRLIQIRAACHRMTQLFHEMIQLSQISQEKLKVQKVDLSELARGKSLELKEGNPARKVEFDIQDGVIVDGDPALLKRVVDHLFTNAWIYSTKEELTRIEFGLHDSGSDKEIFIRDNGIGFQEEESELLFRPFQKLDPDEVYPGSGMGLAIVRRIIHLHGGAIRAESRPGEGAAFYFSL